MPRDQLSLNTGGVCDNCGEPAFSHVASRCPTETECGFLRAKLTAWHAIVAPARDAYQDARRHLKRGENLARKGKASAASVAESQASADARWGEYQAAIRRADREATQ